MLKNLFDRSDRAITCMGILGFAFSAPLLWLMIKVGVGTVVAIPSMASNVKDSSLGLTMLFIGAVASLFIIAGVWGFFGRKAGIIVSIILACVYWKLVFILLFLLLIPILPLVCLGSVVLLIISAVRYCLRKAEERSDLPSLCRKYSKK